MKLIFRPIETLPTEFLNTDQKPPAFTASWTDTLQLLDKEIDLLANGGKFHTDVVLQVAADERAMRLDGGIRADAKVEHDGVIISFESKHGPLRYATNVFRGGSKYVSGRMQHVPGWQQNVRAIALSLEALRKVDRYGVTGRGEQYTGFNALGSGIPMPAVKMSRDQAIRVLMNAAGSSVLSATEAKVNSQVRATLYRLAVRNTHPDSGGSKEAFQELQEAWAVLNG